MAEGKTPVDNADKACRELFGTYVEKAAAKKLSVAEKKVGTGSVVCKILKEVMGYSQKQISEVEASILSKHLVKKQITVDVFMDKLLEDLAKKEGIGHEEMKQKMAEKAQQKDKGTKPKNAAVVDRLTDTKNYTGSHGQRFDKETGKGLGKAGREDMADGSGYVQGYENKGTYGSKK